ncbi:PEP-CTERM sorting domain-containing protein [Thalassomonas viridans]|uniref:PEP-CTERM sorting domain-containing protein n=1 Tax=Thalassomonas viridans TaxID=137584 RepID=A0AAF0C8Q3_9GAMM|nr:PEP-CTERM sorting domain-containing protein [Thalassomonas viridans]WDE06687.1 PEP-CTERM sorting domain-containing protein [Thalassomonas viridans]
MFIKAINTLKVAAICLGLVSVKAIAGPILWSGDSNGTLGTIDVATGDVNIIGSMGVTMVDIAFDPNGMLWGVSVSHLYSIDKFTGQSTLVGELGTTLSSLVFDSAGTLYGANSSLFTIDTTTGAAQNIGNGGDSYSSAGDLAIVEGKLLLSSALGNTLVQLDTSDGSGSVIGNIGYSGVYGLASSNGHNLFGLSGTQVLSINATTGAATSVLDYSGKGLSLSYGTAFVTEASAVPAPATLGLISLGLIGLVLRRKQS